MAKQKIVRILLQNEVHANVSGLHPAETAVLSDTFALLANNYFFHPKFKAKIWDGKIRYFSRGGATYVNLLPEIIPLIKSLGYSIHIKDKRDNLQIKVPPIDKNYLIDFGIELAPHQLNIINAVTSNGGGMIKGGTGAGKTICCWVLHDLYYTHCGFETLVIVPTADLITQTVDEFSKFSSDVGYWGDGKKNIDHPVVVSTWQTLKNNPSFVGKFKHIILDECHGGKNLSAQINTILNDFGKNCYIKTGMTGTFPESASEMRTLECALGPILYEVTAKELIDSGWLAKLNLTMIRLNENFKEEYNQFLLDNPEQKGKLTYAKYKKALFPEYPNETGYYIKNEPRNTFIANFVTVKSESTKLNNCVVLVNTVKHGKELERLIPNSKFIYGKDRTKVRKEMFDLFSAENDVIMITTFGLASIGLNIKRIFVVFMIDSGKSFIRIIQTLGRGLRRADDKSEVTIYDIYGALHYGKDHAIKRVKHYTTEEHEVKKLTVNYR